MNARIEVMHPRLVLSVGNFLSAIYFFLVIYIVAPYLALLMPASKTGLVVSLGALATLILFPFVPQMVRTIGAKRLALILAALQAVFLSVLALSPSVLFAVLCVVVVMALAPILSYQLDLLLEAVTDEEGTTGRVRTLFITAGSVALLLAPLIIGWVLDGTEAYGRVFLFAALSLTPFIALFLFERLPTGEVPHVSKIATTLACIWANPDLRAAALGNGVLQFFFHLAPLYIPLYLHTVLGFPWSDLGWVFAVMLLPFVFLEYPAGIIADKWLGDKEMLIAGFVITGIAFGTLALITASTSLVVIAAILFVSRIGAALVEAMVEGHFFRSVTERDASTITVYRMMRPVGALIAPLFASLLLVTGNYLLFFIVSGAFIVALGIIVTIPLRDVR